MLQQVIIKIKERGVREKSGESSETQNGSITSNKFYANIANQNRNKKYVREEEYISQLRKEETVRRVWGRSVVTLCGTNILNIKWIF